MSFRLKLIFKVSSNQVPRKLYQGRFIFSVRKNLFMEGIIKYWNRLSREVG